MEKLRKNKFNVLYFGIIMIVFLVTRLYQITSLPNGLHIDEMSMGYNAWSLSEYGTDRYGVSWPVYFNNAGSGQSALYVYMVVLLSKIFGYSTFVLRSVSVILGIMLIVFGTLVAWETAGKVCARAFAFVVTIMPFFVMSERWAFDCNALLPVFVMTLYFFIKLLKTGQKRYAILSGIGTSLMLYSYILAFIIVPVFWILSVVYSVLSRKLSFRNLLLMTVSWALCSIPILLYIAVLFHIMPEVHLGAVSITAASANRLSELAWQGYTMPELFQKFLGLMTYDNYAFTADSKYGVFYLNDFYILGYHFCFTQILLIISLLVLICSAVCQQLRHDTPVYEMFILFYFISSLCPMLFMEQMSIYRFNAVFFVFAFAIAYLVSVMWGKNLIVVCGILFIIFFCNFYDYVGYLYGGSFEKEHAALDYFDSDLTEIFETTDFSEYDAVYVDDTSTYNAGLVMLYGLRVSPEDSKKHVKNMDEENMSYRNIHIGIPEEIKDEKALYIIRNANADSSFYTNTREQLVLYEKLAHNNEIKRQLEKSGSMREEKNNYYMFSSVV